MRSRIWVPEQNNPSFRYSSEVEDKIEICLHSPTFVEGKYIVDLIDAETKQIKEHYEFSNVITDSGLNFLGAGALSAGDTISDLFNWLEVGTGTNTPTGSDASLQSPVSPRTNDNGGFSDVNGFVTASGGTGSYHFIRRTRLFEEGEANGNLTELGLWSDNVGGSLGSRALFRDNTSSPITIVKTSLDQLRVQYEWRLFPPTSSVSGAIVLNATTHSFEIRPIDITAVNVWGGLAAGFTATFGNWNIESSVHPSGTLVDATGSVSDTGASIGQIAHSSRSLQGYVPGTFERDMSFTWDPGIANFGPGGIPFVLVAVNQSTVDNFQVQFVPSIPKIDTQRLILVFRQSWNRSKTSD